MRIDGKKIKFSVIFHTGSSFFPALNFNPVNSELEFYCISVMWLALLLELIDEYPTPVNLITIPEMMICIHSAILSSESILPLLEIDR